MAKKIIIDDDCSKTNVLTNTRSISKTKKSVSYDVTSDIPGKLNRKGEGGLRLQGYFKKSCTEKPLISIITVVVNGEKYIEETIKSVIGQTYKNIEYIIIDGGSTDSTLEIIKKYENQIDYWVSEADTGIYNAWNKGVVLSAGEWISFLGSDDYYMTNSINIYVTKILTLNSNIDYVSSKIFLINDAANTKKVIGKKLRWKDFKHYMMVAHVGSLHNVKLFKEYGLFDERFAIAGDYEFLLRKGRDIKAVFVDEITAVMRDGGVSNSNILKAFKEALQAKNRNKSVSFFMAYIDYLSSIMSWLIKKILFLK